VKNDNDLNKIIKITGQISNYTIQPYLDNDNISFFKKNVFVEKTDILNNNDIFQIAANETINKQLFGNVYITESGNIKLSNNASPIGNIKNNSIYKAVYDAFAEKQHHPWFLTREQVEPCKNCVFSKLCPSISNYELFLNKFNFCNIL